MLGGNATRTSKTREQIEPELLDATQRHLHEWRHAPTHEREAARDLFMESLHKFNRLILHGEFPEER